MIADAVYRTRLRTHAERKLMFLMLGCSLILHGGVVLIATVEWGFSRRKPDFAPVYSVELVTLPTPSAKKYQKFYPGSKAKAAAKQKAIPIKRFGAKEQPLKLKKKKSAITPSKKVEEVELAEKTLTKIERPSSPPPTVEKKTADIPRPAAASKKQVSLMNIGGMKGSELSQALTL
ncbi:MAG: hypothetical protein GWN86_22760, partial [Desulfobacterales bacterium]|nr:hypothetical protein [Desulfobacterales bacterium]